MARPTRVKVSPHVVSIQTNDAALAAANASGAWLGDENRIIIESKLALSQEQECLVHELLHAAWQTSGLRGRFPDSEPDSQGEDIINTLAPALLRLVKDNPNLIRYLQEA